MAAQLDFLRRELAGRLPAIARSSSSRTIRCAPRRVARPRWRSSTGIPASWPPWSGHAHRNAVTVRRTGAGVRGLWLVKTASLADFPAAGARIPASRERGRRPRPRNLDDRPHRRTPRGAGAGAAARELAFLDAQGGRPQGFAGAPRRSQRAAVRRRRLSRRAGRRPAVIIRAMLSRVALAAFYLAAGTLHFLRPAMYEAIVPRSLPAKRELVYASGVAELAGGAARAAPARPGAPPAGG